jgi:hypothetical protein
MHSAQDRGACSKLQMTWSTLTGPPQLAGEPYGLYAATTCSKEGDLVAELTGPTQLSTFCNMPA